MKKQIQYILEELNSNKYEDSEQDEKYDEENEDDDVLEDEDIYEEDMVKIIWNQFEEESINEDEINIHNDILKEFIINNSTQNIKVLVKSI